MKLRYFQARWSAASTVAVAIGALAMNGCAHRPTPNATATARPASIATAAPKLKLGFVTNSRSNFWILAQKGVEQAEADLHNVSVQFIMPPQQTVTTQQKLMDGLLSEGVNGIITDPIDPVGQVPYLNAVAAKTILLIQDSDAPTSNRLCFIGSDNAAAGKMAADLLKEALPHGGDVMVFVGNQQAQNAREREQGLRYALKGSGIRILGVETDHVNMAVAKANVVATLKAHPDIAGMVGLWSYNGPAILSAVQDAHKIGRVKIVCFDDEDDTLRGVKSGAIFGTIVQQPYEFGYVSVKLLVDIARGDKSGVPANKLKIIPTQAVRQDNVDAVIANRDKLRGV
jgi:ribose transport system substrate-binding protein